MRSGPSWPDSSKSCRARRRTGVRSRQHSTMKEGKEEVGEGSTGSLYCPTCQEEVKDPLVCGDCAAVICRRCGTALERVDELGIG